jgi:hypothetical protein
MARSLRLPRQWVYPWQSVRPPTGSITLHAQVSVNDLVNGGNIVAEFRGNVVVSGVSRLVVVWSNVNHTQTFRLVAGPQTIWGGGVRAQS